MQLAGFSHVALTVSDIRAEDFHSAMLGLTVLDSSETCCALLVGGRGLTALILTSHEGGSKEPFSELRPGLDHVSLAVSDVASLSAWQRKLSDRGVASDMRSSAWGHHRDFRDPDNIAVELVALQPDADTREVLGRAGLV